MPTESTDLEKALKRPANYRKLSEREQWEIDSHLGILDWEPTPEEIKEYRHRRIALYGKL